MVSVGRHPKIKLLAYSEIESVSGYVGNYQVRVRRKPRYVDETKCTGCGNCASVCPIEVINEFDHGLSTRKAAYRFSAQSVPGAFAIDKKGMAPCRAACPTDQRAQGYIALVKQKRYADAYWAIRREHPFPSVCGRVCNRNCEAACSRGKVDEPVNVMGIKRFVQIGLSNTVMNSRICAINQSLERLSSTTAGHREAGGDYRSRPGGFDRRARPGPSWAQSESL